MMKIIDVLKSWYAPWREYFAEFVGTYILVLVSLGLVLVNNLYQNLEPLAVSLSLGFLYAGLIYATAHLSGGFLNPAISLSLWFVKKLSGKKTIFFLISQTLASLAAAGSVYYIFGKKSLDFGLGFSTIAPDKLQIAIILEVILTAFLVFGVFSTMVDRNGPVSFGPLIVGLLTVPLTLFALPISGAIFNPAKVLAAGIITKNYATLTIGLIGPLTASLFAFVYDFLYLRRSQKPHS